MLVRGDRLSESARREVLAAYGYRWTVENEARARHWYGNKGMPRVALITDVEWLAAHAFDVVKDGSRLSRRSRGCWPASLANTGEVS